MIMNGSKTPSRNHSQLSTSNSKTPLGINKSVNTPGRITVKHRSITPSRHIAASNNFVSNGQKTPTNGGDRFIPTRSASMVELGHMLITSQNDNSSNSNSLFSHSAENSPRTTEYRRVLSESLQELNGSRCNYNNSEDFRILSFQTKAPLAPSGFLNSQKILYTQRPNTVCKKSSRHIPMQPERVLDAPEIKDDYYLNFLDWNCKNVMAVALNTQVFIWDATTGNTSELLQLDNPSDYICSVSWEASGKYLAVGISTGVVELWDMESSYPRRVRTLKFMHNERVSCLTWNQHVLTTGARNGHINHNDVRLPQHVVANFIGHSQEVCGLQWAPDGRYLASGGNDNLLLIWAADGQITRDRPLHTLSEHLAAVKAISWCPWQYSILASGGGTNDRNIRIWNCNNGQSLASVDTQSQVCSIQWSQEYKELISGHGFPNHELIIWKYPALTPIAQLRGHTQRILSLALSPDKEMVVSASADETLRIWHCFAQDPAKKKSATVETNSRRQQQTHGTITNRIIR